MSCVYKYNGQTFKDKRSLVNYYGALAGQVQKREKSVEDMVREIVGIKKYKGIYYITKHGFAAASTGIAKLNTKMKYPAVTKHRAKTSGQGGREIWYLKLHDAPSPDVPIVRPIGQGQYEYGGDIYPSYDEADNVRKKDAGEFLQKDSDPVNTPADPKVDAKMKDILDQMGVAFEDFEAYRSYYESKFKKTLNAVAVADMFRKSIAVKEGSADLHTLPEETAHFILFALQGDPIVKDALANIHTTEEWKRDFQKYMKEYDNNESKVRLEILGKMMSDSLINAVQDTSPKWLRKLRRIWARFVAMFSSSDRAKGRKIRATLDSISEAAISDSRMLQKTFDNQKKVATDHFFTIDPSMFEHSAVLNNLREELHEAITVIKRKINLYNDRRGKSGFVEKEEKVRKMLAKHYFNGTEDSIAEHPAATTMGIVNFLAHAESQAQQVLSRIPELREKFSTGVYDDNLNDMATLVREMSQYISVFKPIVNSLSQHIIPYMNRVENDPIDPNGAKKLLPALETLKHAIHEINDGINVMEEDYMDYSKNLMAASARPYFVRRHTGHPDQDKLVEKNMEEYLESLSITFSDLNAKNRHMDSMANSKDDVLMVMDRLVKQTIEDAQLDTYDDSRDIIDHHEKLLSAGISNTDFMYEVHDGQYTRNFVTRYNMYKYDKAKNKFFDDLNKKYGLPVKGDDPKVWASREKKLSNMASSDPNKFADYNLEIKEWFEENTDPNPDWAKIGERKLRDIRKSFITFDKDIEFVEHMRKKHPKTWIREIHANNPTLARRERAAYIAWVDWYNERYVEIHDGISFRREFAVPKEALYGNKQYDRIMENPAMKAYYEGVMTKRKKLLHHMSDEYRNSTIAPQFRKDSIERLKNDPKRVLSKFASDTLTITEDEYDRGNVTLDENDKEIMKIPIFNFKPIEDVNDMSLDFSAGMILLAETANRHRNLSQIQDLVEISGDVLRERTIGTGRKGGGTFGRDEKVGKGGEAYARYMKYVEMTFYGRQKKDEGKIAGTSLDKAKVVDAINRYSSLNSLALNIYSGINNVMLGNLLMFQESFAKEFVDHDDLKYAEKKYWGSHQDGISGLLGDVGNLTSSNRLRLFVERFDILQDHENRMREVNTDRARFSRMFNTSTLFFVNHIGEHHMQVRLGIALMHRMKVKDANGDTIPFYEAFEVKDNRLVLSKGITHPDGRPVTKEDIIAMRLRIKGINQRLHGIYNVNDRSAMQQYAAGRLVILFRKWMIPWFNRRFDDHYYDYSIESEFEGMYRTFAHFMTMMYKELRSDQYTFASVTQGQWDKLSSMQKANMRRNLVEFSSYLVLSSAGAILASLAGDDDDNWSLNMLAYQVNRLATEFGVFIPVLGTSETLKIIKSPAAAVNQIDGIMRIAGSVRPVAGPLTGEDIFPTYKTGINKGRYKIGVAVQKAIPVVDNVNDIFTPEMRLKYFISAY